MIDNFRTGKAYTVTQAARLAGTSPQNIGRWLRGYAAAGHQMAPVFGPRSPDAPRTISFLELAEIIVVAKFRQRDPRGKRRISLDRLRKAHGFARREFGLEYPFASRNLKLEGGHVLHDFDLHHPDKELIALDMNGQWVLPFPVQRELESFDFDPDDHLARRWYPQGRDGRIIVDPHIAAGRPPLLVPV